MYDDYSCTLPCYAVLCCAVLCYAMLYYTILCSMILYYREQVSYRKTDSKHHHHQEGGWSIEVLSQFWCSRHLKSHLQEVVAYRISLFPSWDNMYVYIYIYIYTHAYTHYLVVCSVQYVAYIVGVLGIPPPGKGSMRQDGKAENRLRQSSCKT